MTELEILDDAELARRWFYKGTPEAIARRLDRVTNKKRAGHLKSFKGGNKRLYRIEDVRAFEARAKHFVSSFANETDAELEELLFGKDVDAELRELDPAVGTEHKPTFP